MEDISWQIIFLNYNTLYKTMKKQTALEYLFEQLWETPKDKFTWNAILEKAKEKEKQIIRDNMRGYNAAQKLLKNQSNE